MSYIYGRDKIVEVIQQRLEDKSIIFVAERRIGKTTVLDLLRERHSDDCIMVYRDLEKIKSVEELENEVYKSIKEYISLLDRTKLRSVKNLEDFLSRFKHKDVEYRQEKNWKELFENSIRNVCDNTDKRVVFLWDELPYMLQNVYKKDIEDSTQNALDIVDILRTLDSEVKNLRFVFTGSIGLHHIAKVITRGSNSEPFNKLDRIELKPLIKEYAEEMIVFNLEKERVNYASDNNIVELIFNECDAVPFYMERVIKRLGVKDEDLITYDMVKDEIKLMIVDSKNELEMEHFVTRLEIYYDESIKDIEGNEIRTSQIAKLLIDQFASVDEPLTLEECFRYLKTKFAIDDPGIVKNIIDLLVKDYYITVNKNQEYVFTFSIIKRWWFQNEVHDMGGSDK